MHLFLFTNSAQIVYATAINFPCIITLDHKIFQYTNLTNRTQFLMVTLIFFCHIEDSFPMYIVHQVLNLKFIVHKF